MKQRRHSVPLEDLIEQIYAAAEDPRLWEPMLVALLGAVRGSSASLVTHDLSTRGLAVSSAGIDPEALRQYNEHYHRLDIWAITPAARALTATGRAFTDEAVMPRHEAEKTEFHGFVRRYGLDRMLHATLSGPGRPTEGLSLHRAGTDAPFGSAEIALLDALTPHLQRALRLRRTLAVAADERATLLDQLDRLQHGVLLVRGHSTVVHANRYAAQVLAAHDGLRSTDAGLVGANPATTSALRTLCAECARTTRGEGLGAGGPLLLPRRSGKRPLQVLVTPLKRSPVSGLEPQATEAVVLVVDPERRDLPDAALLQAFYGLTPTEAAVAARLAAGEELEAIADALGHTTQTARWYSKQVLAKVGVRSRAALVRQVSTTLAAIRLDAGAPR